MFTLIVKFKYLAANVLGTLVYSIHIKDTEVMMIHLIYPGTTNRLTYGPCAANGVGLDTSKYFVKNIVFFLFFFY